MSPLKLTEICTDTIAAWSGDMAAPSAENRKRTDGIRVFENGFVERYFASAHPVMPGLWVIPLVTYALYLGVMSLSVGRILGLFVAGFLVWTLLEYVLHRWLFHLSTEGHPERKQSVFMMHGYHHEFPSDRLRLVAPLFMSWPVTIVVGGLYYLALGPDASWWVMLAGTAAGYLAYDWIHYYTHHFRPTTRVGKFLRRYHMEHHFKNADTHFGISSPLWDLVFGTFSRPTEVEFDDAAGSEEGARSPGRSTGAAPRPGRSGSGLSPTAGSA